MAGTVDDNTIPADWPLASDELAFVTKLVGEERAMEVMDSLLDDLAKGLIRWDCECDGLVVRGDFRAYPSLPITFAAARGRAFFWRRDEHSRLNVDWPASCAAWVGPLSGFGSDGMGNSWPTFDPCASTSLTASGVRFHHGDVVDRLVARGLMPRPSESPPSDQQEKTEETGAVVAPVSSYDWRIELQSVEELISTPPSPSLALGLAAVEIADEVAVTGTVVPLFPTLAMLELEGRRIRPQMAVVWRVFHELYCGDARNIPESLTAALLRQKIKAKIGHRGTGDKCPSRDVCERFMRALRAWQIRSL
jgi:hypothetical protein